MMPTIRVGRRIDRRTHFLILSATCYSECKVSSTLLKCQQPIRVIGAILTYDVVCRVRSNIRGLYPCFYRKTCCIVCCGTHVYDRQADILLTVELQGVPLLRAAYRKGYGLPLTDRYVGRNF